jgi:hypothetical protein
MTFQAFMDESYTEGGTYVLAGYIAREETWRSFSDYWTKLLPNSVLGKDGRYRFKMREMAHFGRMARVPEFYSIIEKYDPIRLSCKIDVSDVERAKIRMSVDNLGIYWNYTDNPYSLSFRCLMDMFHTHRANFDPFFPAGEQINFIFDARKEQKAIVAMWDDYIRQRPDEVRGFYGDRPIFGDDNDFMPLQAADFWAWWVRKWYDRGTPEKIETEVFDGWQAAKKPRGIAISFDEDQIAEFFFTHLRDNLGFGRRVFDTKYAPSPVVPEGIDYEIVSWAEFWRSIVKRIGGWFAKSQ